MRRDWWIGKKFFNKMDEIRGLKVETVVQGEGCVEGVGVEGVECSLGALDVG